MIKYGDVVVRPEVLFVEVLQLGGVRWKEELLQSVGQSRARLDLSDIFRPEGELVLARPLRCFTLWDTAKTWKTNMDFFNLESEIKVKIRKVKAGIRGQEDNLCVCVSVTRG